MNRGLIDQSKVFPALIRGRRGGGGWGGYSLK